MTPLMGIVTVVMGLGVGITSALFGVGGGIVMIPFMVLVLELTQHVAEGTSLLVIVPTALVGAIAHDRRGYVERRAVGWLAAGGIVGAVVGALVGLGLSGEILSKLFAILVALVGAFLIYDGVRERRRPASGLSPPRA